MPYVALGVVALVLLVLVAKAFVAANPAHLAKGLRWASLVILLLGAGALEATGRISLAPILVPFLYLLVRGWRPSWLPAWFPGGIGGAARQPSPGQISSIRTDFLELSLDHDTGALSGEVLRGRFAGRRIESLGKAELIALWQETGGADPQSAQLVETCLERSFPDWRDAATADGGPPRAAAGAMDRTEALRVLGLSGDPTPAEVTEAHHRLMQTNHPDRGGSAYLAAMINEAKRVLTGTR